LLNEKTDAARLIALTDIDKRRARSLKSADIPHRELRSAV
jgi:hypothetical protein